MLINLVCFLELQIALILGDVAIIHLEAQATQEIRFLEGVSLGPQSKDCCLFHVHD